MLVGRFAHEGDVGSLSKAGAGARSPERDASGACLCLAFLGGEDSMSGFLTLRRSLLGAGIIGLAAVLTACGSSGGGADGGGSGKKVYMLLPNTTTVRFVTQDGP